MIFIDFVTYKQNIKESIISSYSYFLVFCNITLFYAYSFLLIHFEDEKKVKKKCISVTQIRTNVRAEIWTFISLVSTWIFYRKLSSYQEKEKNKIKDDDMTICFLNEKKNTQCSSSFVWLTFMGTQLINIFFVVFIELVRNIIKTKKKEIYARQGYFSSQIQNKTIH